MKKWQIGLTAAVGLIFLGGCANSNGSKNATAATTEEKADTTIHLAAAASLEYAFEEKLIPMYEKEYDKVKIEGTYDSSGNLQTQIEQGMDTDIFFSAATQQMDELIAEELIDKDSEIGLLENKLVLITPENNPKEVEDFADLKNADTIAIGDPESVPAGQYAQESLTNLDLWDSLKDRFSMGTNVIQVLNWVAENSADAGLVYETDAKTTADVTVIDEAPEESIKDPIRYPVAQLEDSQNAKTAKDFLTFLQTDETVKVFEDYGFTAAQ